MLVQPQAVESCAGAVLQLLVAQFPTRLAGHVCDKKKFGRSMRVLRLNNGLEFCNQKMSEYLASRGIKKENTASYTPQQNGKSERNSQTIVKSSRTMIYAKNLPLSLWEETVNSAVYVLNKTVWSVATHE